MHLRDTQMYMQRQDIGTTVHTGCPSQGLSSAGLNIKQKQIAETLPSSPDRKDRSSLSECTPTVLYRFTSTNTFTDPSSTIAAPLSTQDPCLDARPTYPLHWLPTHQLVQLEVCCKHTHTHTLLPHRHDICSFPWLYQHRLPACQIPHPRSPLFTS